jgi:hypothetical protein
VSIHAAALINDPLTFAEATREDAVEFEMVGAPPDTIDDAPRHTGQRTVADFVPIENDERYAVQRSICDAGSDRTVGPASIMTRAPTNTSASALSLCVREKKGGDHGGSRPIDSAGGCGGACAVELNEVPFSPGCRTTVQVSHTCMVIESDAMKKWRAKMAIALAKALDDRDVPRAYYVQMRIKRIVEERD